MDIGFSEEQATAEAVTPEFWTRRSLTYYAAWAVDGKEADAPLAVSMAKSYASDASPKGSNAGI